jgi:hypothetical protein
MNLPFVVKPGDHGGFIVVYEGTEINSFITIELANAVCELANAGYTLGYKAGQEAPKPDQYTLPPGFFVPE